MRQIGCVSTSKFKCAWALKHDDITKWLDCFLAWMWPVSICNPPTVLESGGVYQHKGRLLHASWPQNPGAFNLPVQTYPLGPCAVWDWTQVNKSFCSDLCLSPPGATLCWVKTIQDFTLVAFYFNPFCNIHTQWCDTSPKIYHAYFPTETGTPKWWQAKACGGLQASTYYLPLRETWTFPPV